jgi:hypothetical protein
MISLVVLGLLMAAVAVAFNASAINYAANEDMFQAMSTARQAMMRITSDLRSAVVEVGESADVCSMVTADGRDISYQYDGANNILNLVVTGGANPGTYVLCKNVTAMTFNKTLVPDDDSKMRSVRLSMTVTVDNASQTVSSAAVMRRNLEP